MAGQTTGSLVAATFGLIYVLVNSGSLPAEASSSLRGLAVVVYAVVVAQALRARPRDGESTGGPQGTVFGRAYWSIVAAEAAAIWVGVWVLNRFLDVPEAGVAWVSVVVGVHFFGLARVFQQPFFHLLGVVITACGAVALLLAVVGADEAAVDVVGGVVPGGVLLVAGWWGARRSSDAQPADGQSSAGEDVRR